MPSRTITIAIIAFWLGMTIWLADAEVWPRLQPGQPPPFTIDLMDDSQAMPVPTRWSAEHSYGSSERKTASYSISSSVDHHSKEDVFELFTRLEPRRGGTNIDEDLRLKKLETVYRLKRDGSIVRLVRLDATITYLLGRFESTSRVTAFAGEVDGNVCRLWREGEGPGEAVAVGVSWSGAVLLPLHPIHRMEGLRPGQRWGMYLFDPLSSAARTEPHVTWVNVRVRSEKESLRWHTQDRVCLVVDYDGGGSAVACSTWVDVEDSRVLRMTVRLGDSDSWDITRD